eukprot:scaffold319308_cov56-Prasinocladus_malaysianus.AAC.1
MERALSWILYQRFVRRAKGTQDSRQVFIRARKWADCPWQVYVASALMEWEYGREEKASIHTTHPKTTQSLRY